MSERVSKAKKLKMVSRVIGMIGLACLVFSRNVTQALSELLGGEVTTEMTVIGVGITSVLLFLYLNTLAKKAAEDARPEE